MSGHNKWSTIKHRKGAQDAKRGKIFTKIIKEITVASRLGGEFPESNPRLRAAIAWSKSANMPNDNVNKAIKKGIGAQQGADYQEITYEGYGPGNIAVIVECLTDNKNRTISSIRSIFNKNHGALGASNSVLYMFEKRGEIRINKSLIDEDALTERILETEVDDIESSDEEFYLLLTQLGVFSNVVQFLEKQEIAIESAEITLEAQNKVEINEPEKARQVLKFLDALEDDDDVQKVYSNLDLSDEVLAGLSSE